MALKLLSHWFSRYGSWSLLGPALLIGLGRGFIIPVLPIIARDEFAIGAAQATFIFAAISVGTLISTLPTGYLVDRIGRRKVLIAGPLLSAVSCVLVFQATWYWEVVLYLILNGFALQMWLMGRLAAVADTGKANERGKLITGMSGMQRTGVLLGPFIGGLIGTFVGLRYPFLLYAIMGLISALIMLVSIRETSPTLLARRAGEPESSEPSPSWREMVTRTVAVFFSAQFLSNIARGGMAGHTGPAFIFAAYAYNLTAATLGSISLIVGIISVPVTFLAGHIIDRFGRKSAYVPAAQVLGLSLLGFALAAAFNWPLWLYIAAYAVGNISLAFMAGTMQTISSDIAPPHSRGKFLGVSRLTVASGELSGPAVYAGALGLLAVPGGYVAGFGVMVLAAFGSSSLINRLYDGRTIRSL